MWESFQIRVPGKWVIAGEHAVLRGGTAVALPHPEFALELRFQPQVWEGFSVVPQTATEVVRSILTEAARLRGFTEPRGTLELESSIPVGAGLGSSAALCVAVTDWLNHDFGLSAEQRRQFATSLEHTFHGRSSGMDVAAIVSAQPISFSTVGGPIPLDVRKLPPFTFHDTGLRASTRDCIAKVAQFAEAHPQRAEETDRAMAEAAIWAAEALETGDLRRLADALRQGQRCFETWGLMPPAAQAQVQQLLADGALAVKLTGAGGGGFLVALWRSKQRSNGLLAR